MNILMPRLQDCRWLDLCSGSGVMGCEAIQRGASEVIAVEKDKRTAVIAEKNLQATASSRHPIAKVAVVSRSVESWLDSAGASAAFDLIYFDPPYEAGLYQPVLETLSRTSLLKTDGLLVCEHDMKCPPEPDERSWTIHDRRNYGRTGLLFLKINRPEHCHGGTDSMQPRTNPEA